MLWLIAGWVWFILAGVGGFLLLLREGPLPLTNGWFALLSGLSAWPLTEWAFKKVANVQLSGRVRLAATAFFFISGRIALAIAPHFPNQRVL